MTILRSDFDDDAAAVSDPAAFAAQLAAPSGIAAAITDEFSVFAFGGDTDRADWPIGVLLAGIGRDDVAAVTGELSETEDGLIAWFLALPGEVTLRDGRRVILRLDPGIGHQIEVR